jgi:PAS domain S-box-containing protein
LSAVEFSPSPLRAGYNAGHLVDVLAAARIGYWEHDLLTDEFHVSDEYKANCGLPPETPFTLDTLQACVHPDDWPVRVETIRQSIESGSPLDLEYRVIWPDGSLHWVHTRAQTQYDARNEPLRVVGIALDITARKNAEEALRAETQTLELLNKLGVVLGGDLDLDCIVQNVTDVATQLIGAQFGVFLPKGPGLSDKPLVPDDISAWLPIRRDGALLAQTFGGNMVRSDDLRRDERFLKDQLSGQQPITAPRLASYLAMPVISRSGTVFGGLFFGHEQPGVFSERSESLVKGIAAQAAITIDNAQLFRSAQDEIAKRRRFEQHQDLLLAEINHRVKNTLAIVLSIATQTLRNSASPEAFRSSFEARILALAEAHNLLTDGNWEGASLRAIFERVLRPYQGGGTQRYVVTGERDVDVGPKTAVALVMALNELATNAAKFGALSATSGVVMIRWTVTSESPLHIHLDWEEVGGPAVTAPSRTGFGTRLIRSLASDASAKVVMDFAPDGFVCTFDLPLRGGVES